MTGKQLKNSILQWAIQGKLVPQDPNDEPASVLLERIREEKERLIKEKKIKRDKNASIIYRGDDNSHYEKFLATGEVKCIDEEIPFEIPCEWKWCRLRDIVCGTNAGKSPNCEKRPKQDREWGVLTTTAIQENEFRPDENKVLPQGYVINPEHCIKYGDILITRAGPVNRTGVACLVDKACDKLILSDKTIRIDYLRNYCNPAFLVLVLNCPDIHNLIMCMTVGMAASQVNVSQSNIQNTLIPFPPLAEQHHIVERVEMLLPIINKFNKTQISLDKLNSLMNDFLKKSILQEAIQGKLVEQCPDEEPASELLNRIKAEKERLIKEKIIKRDKQESIIYKGNDNSYYERIGNDVQQIDCELTFPTHWEIVRLGSICQLIDGTKQEGSQPLLDAKFLRGKVSATLLNKGRYVKKGDQIMLVDGENSGEVFTAPQSGYMGSTFKQLWVSSGLYLPYILAFILFYKDVLRNSKKGAAIPHLNREIFNNLVVGIPPYNEQKRLMNKVDKLFEQLK